MAGQPQTRRTLTPRAARSILRLSSRRRPQRRRVARTFTCPACPEPSRRERVRGSEGGSFVRVAQALLPVRFKVEHPCTAKSVCEESLCRFHQRPLEAVQAVGASAATEEGNPHLINVLISVMEISPARIGRGPRGAGRVKSFIGQRMERH